mmetsp:Transcript_1234/g.3456  ORF Transcript_1234/g.3456 Transcript_1234/m.3456 type:complete len:213 (+) Transcript_1234:487-1125(+)
MHNLDVLREGPRCWRVRQKASLAPGLAWKFREANALPLLPFSHPGAAAIAFAAFDRVVNVPPLRVCILPAAAAERVKVTPDRISRVAHIQVRRVCHKAQAILLAVANRVALLNAVKEGPQDVNLLRRSFPVACGAACCSFEFDVAAGMAAEDLAPVMHRSDGHRPTRFGAGAIERHDGQSGNSSQAPQALPMPINSEGREDTNNKQEVSRSG